MRRRRADIWAKRKGEKLYSWYFRRTNLRTKDADEARRRVKLLESGQPLPTDPAEVADQAFAASPATETEAAKQEPGGAPVTSHVADGGAPGDWTGDAAAAAGGGASPGPEASAAPAVDNTALADLAVTVQLKGCEFYAQRRVFRAFIAPELPPEARRQMALQYKTILDYAGTKVQLPPWVQGLAVPAAVLMASAVAMAQAFAELAEQQKRAAGGT